MFGSLIGGFLTILVGATIAGTVADEVKLALYLNGNTSTPTNVTGASNTILGLTTLFFVLGVASAGIAVAAIGLRQSGLLGL